MIIDVRYTQTLPVTKETKYVIESFGLADKKEHVIADNFEFPFKEGSLYFFCGYSGSGKSSILRKITENLKKDGYTVLHVEKWQDLEIENKPLIEFFSGIAVQERLRLLGKAGLGEAWKWVTPYRLLSDGEKFRFCLYHSIMTLKGKPKAVLVFDEFCSTLDRVTAKAIATNLKKMQQSAGITVIVATAHMDISSYINADFAFYKDYSGAVDQIQRDNHTGAVPKPDTGRKQGLGVQEV